MATYLVQTPTSVPLLPNGSVPCEPFISGMRALPVIPRAAHSHLRTILSASLGVQHNLRLRAWAVSDATTGQVRVHVFRRDLLVPVGSSAAVVTRQPTASAAGTVPATPFDMMGGDASLGQPPPPPYSTIARGDAVAPGTRFVRPTAALATLNRNGGAPPPPFQSMLTVTPEPSAPTSGAMPGGPMTLAHQGTAFMTIGRAAAMSPDGLPPAGSVRLGVVAFYADADEPGRRNGAVIDDGVALADDGTVVVRDVPEALLYYVRRWALFGLESPVGSNSGAPTTLARSGGVEQMEPNQHKQSKSCCGGCCSGSSSSSPYYGGCYCDPYGCDACVWLCWEGCSGLGACLEWMADCIGSVLGGCCEVCADCGSVDCDGCGACCDGCGACCDALGACV
ncbi:hypothetical protein BC828DRAFT_412539 [Blastocladiella britannica]|nr:hypothetical protein BC828DRAFT_412539 [Blastocladiella britannica]